MHLELQWTRRHYHFQPPQGPWPSLLRAGATRAPGATGSTTTRALQPWAGRGDSNGCLLDGHPVLFKKLDWTAGEAEALSLQGPLPGYLGDVSSAPSCGLLLTGSKQGWWEGRGRGVNTEHLPVAGS